MRLFHVSEQPDIQVFQPRIPTRKELDQTTGLVWAMDEAHLPNYLTPRECPRVAYHVGSHTTPEDRKRFFTSSGLSYGLVLEGRWFPAMERTTSYLYEFDPRDFVLQDAVAGYYVAKTTQIPLKRCALTGLFQELVRRKVEVRLVDNLWEMADAVMASTLQWSLCKMGNALPRPSEAAAPRSFPGGFSPDP